MVLFSGYGNATTWVALEALKSLLMDLVPTLALWRVAPHNGIDPADLLLSKEKFIDMLKRRFPPISLDSLYTLGVEHAGTISNYLKTFSRM